MSLDGRRLTPRPTPAPALVRAVLVGLIGGLAAVLVHRVDLLVVVTPLLVYAAAAVASRRRLDGASVGLAPASSQMREGDEANLRIVAPPGLVVSVVADPPEHARLDPAHGAFAGSTDLPEELRLGFQPLLWGRYEVGPARFALGDRLGAWRLLGETGVSRVQVRPYASRLEGASGVARPIGIAGMHRSARRGEGTELAGVREFVPGDRLRRVNWKVSSRTGRLHVTETFSERDTDVLVVADTLMTIEGAGDEPSSLDATVRAVAAIAQHYVSFGDRVALHDLGLSIGDLRSGTGPRQVRMLLDRLAQSRRDLPDQWLVRRVPRLAPGTLVFGCSPLLDDTAVTELVRLRQLGGELVVIDTLPTALGRQPVPGRDNDWLAEGWMLRRLERDRVVDRLRAIGVPVTPWRGPASLASVLLAMEAARGAPRLRGGRR